VGKALGFGDVNGNQHFTLEAFGAFHGAVLLMGWDLYGGPRLYAPMHREPGLTHSDTPEPVWRASRRGRERPTPASSVTGRVPTQVAGPRGIGGENDPGA